MVSWDEAVYFLCCYNQPPNLEKTMFMRRPHLTACALLLCTITLFGCEGVTGSIEETPATGAVSLSKNGNGVVASATGGGQYLLAGVLDVKFSFSAHRKADGTAQGSFRQSVISEGLLISFHGTVTCVSVDPVNHRAWIGGVVKHNKSEDPDFMQAIHQPGRDVWFRVLDNGQGPDDPDRLTFLGFEGAAGFATSQEYCDGMPWPDENARTHPVTQGNLQVQP